MISLARRGPLPEIIIEPFGYGYLFTSADGGAVIGVPALGEIGSTNGTPLYLSDTRCHVGPRAALIAHLNHILVFFGYGYQHFAFIGVMAMTRASMSLFSNAFRKSGWAWGLRVASFPTASMHLAAARESTSEIVITSKLG